VPLRALEVGIMSSVGTAGSRTVEIATGYFLLWAWNDAAVIWQFTADGQTWQIVNRMRIESLTTMSRYSRCHCGKARVVREVVAHD
jgi:hypothetical protein